MNLYQKLVAVRKAVPYLQKESKGHQYNYVGSSQVLASVRQKLDELNVLLVARVIDKRVTMDTIESTDKYNNIKHTTTYFTELDMEFTWINADNPEETITIPWYGQGIDIAGEKGVGKAMTYAEKYFMLKQFNIATDQDDPDRFQSKHGLHNDDTSQSLYSQTHSANKQIDGLDGRAVAIPDQDVPEHVEAVYRALAPDGKVDVDKMRDWYNKQLKLGYSEKQVYDALEKKMQKKAKEAVSA